jgi:polysaccharide export outer membrane protein
MKKLVFGMMIAGAVAHTDRVSAQGMQYLRPGDIVEVVVWRNEEMSGEFMVDDEGRLVHPLYRDVRVSDVPLDQVEDRLGTFLQRLEANPQFTVQPLIRISVGGEVRNPNLYNLPPSTSVVEAVAVAGGANNLGKWDDVSLIRDGSSYKLDLTSPSTHLEAMLIRSGDQVIVGRRSTVFRDVVGPLASVVAAITGLIVVATR